MGFTTELRDYRLELVSPLTTAHGVVTHRSGVLFSLSDGTHTGWGETAPLPGWSRESLSHCRKTLEIAAARMARLDGFDDPRGVDVLMELEAQPYARVAVVGAFLDLTAKQDGVTVASLISNQFASGPERALLRSVPVNGLISHGEPEKVAAAAEALVTERISAIKLKVAAVDPQTDIARVSAARSAIGDDVALCLDANGGWDVDTAISTLRAMADCNVAYCEEPTTGIDGIAAVGAAGAVRVAVDESAVTVEGMAAALRTNTIEVVIVKPQALGGSDFAMAVIGQAEDFGATVVVTSMIDSAVGVAHAAHVAVAALPLEAHGLATSSLLVDDVAPPFKVAGGRLHIPKTPGLGVSPTA